MTLEDYLERNAQLSERFGDVVFDAFLGNVEPGCDFSIALLFVPVEQEDLARAFRHPFQRGVDDRVDLVGENALLGTPVQGADAQVQFTFLPGAGAGFSPALLFPFQVIQAFVAENGKQELRGMGFPFRIQVAPDRDHRFGSKVLCNG